MIRELKETSKVFNSCNFTFESRASNFEARKLARYGINLPIGRHIWLGAPFDTNVILVNILDSE